MRKLSSFAEDRRWLVASLGRTVRWLADLGVAMVAGLILLHVAPASVALAAEEALPVTVPAIGALPAAAPAAEPSPPAAPAVQETIPISRLELSPSEILSEDEVAAIRAAYEGRSVTVEQLLQMIEEINALYEEKGFIATALLPEQTVEDGVVEVVLVEARVGRIEVEDNRSTRPDYVTSRVGLGPDELLDINRLDAAITYFNRTNDAKLHAQLVPGQTFGTTDVVVLVREPQRNQFLLGMETTGGSGFRGLRSTLTWQHSSLTGLRDSLTGNFTYANGTLGGTVSYNVPVNRMGLRLGLSSSLNTEDIIEDDGDKTGLNRHWHQSTVTLSGPQLIAEAITTLGSIEWQTKTFETFLYDTLLTESTNRSLTLAYTVESQLPGMTWVINQGLRGGTVVADGILPESYLRYNVTGQRVWFSPSGSRWVLRGGLQYALTQSLPPDEQFSLGGMATVRGIKDGVLRGDRGYLAALEYHRPLREWLEVVVFVDHGGVGDIGPSSQSGNGKHLTSLGIGMTMQLRKSTTLTLTTAWPLGKDRASLKGEQLLIRMSVLF